MNKIALAVEPLRQASMDRAEQATEKRINEAIAELEAHGMDIEKVAPFPHSRMSRNDYVAKQGYYNFVHSFTRGVRVCYFCKGEKHRDDDQVCSVCEGAGIVESGSHTPGTPNIVQVRQDLVQMLLKRAREDASTQYDAFIAKLTKKVVESLNGEPDEVELSGDHVWGYSFLKVQKHSPKVTSGNGSMFWTTLIETWKTQQIINVSKLGTLYNQWPSRKVKA
jgi:hypothetical protein